MRDYSSLYRDGTCALCGQPRTIAGQDVHSEGHLSRGEAETLTEHGVTRVLPLDAMPNDAPTTPVFRAKRVDPRLLALARAALKRARKPS